MSGLMATDNPTPATDPLADPGLRRALEDFVRRRVSSADVDDVVQTVLCDALAAPGRPKDDAELRRWVIGIARHKVADHHRRASREQASELPEVAAPPPPIEARELARWAEEQARSTRDAKQTLAWMAREGEGEKLESIAADEQVPAARVRQRVSRMRRWMKERWIAELAAVAALAILAILIARLLRDERPEIAPRPEPPPTTLPETPSPLERARALRAEAFKACDEAAWERCIERLDEAARLDPAGDAADDVRDARARAQKALDDLRAPPAPTDAPQLEDEKSKEAPTPILKPKTTVPAPTFAPKKEPFSTTPTGVKPTPKPRPKARSKELSTSDPDFGGVDRTPERSEGSVDRPFDKK